jgi:TolB-like protein
MKNSYPKLYKLFILFIVSTGFVHAQVRIAVSDFTNKSNALFLDSWERSVPNLLRSNLSASDQVVVLDRNKLDKVLEEQALTMSGLMDSSNVKSIGKLLGAEFILSGTIDQVNDEIVISADLIRVKTGEIQTELVRARNKEYKEAMVEMLSENLLYRLTGDGTYQREKVFTSNSIWYWTGATILLSGATLFTNSMFRENQDKYNSANSLKEYDKYFDKTNNSKTLFTGFAVTTGIALIGTVIDLISGDESNTIQSGRSAQSSINSHIYVTGKEIGIQIHF